MVVALGQMERRRVYLSEVIFVVCVSNKLKVHLTLLL